MLEMIVECLKDNDRQGPGSEEATLHALSYIPEPIETSEVLDIGCGTGGQTMTLALHTKARITAVDMLPRFLDKLKGRIDARNLSSRVTVKKMLMDSLEFEERSFDLIWSEGAIYNIGFENGLSLWRPYLKDGGYIAVSEISWLTDTRPEEVKRYWVDMYPEIDTVANKLAVLERCGYTPVAHFTLGESCWLDNYYRPLLARSEEFLKKYGYSDEVKEFIKAGETEADLYVRFKEYYSYEFYIARKSRQA